MKNINQIARFHFPLPRFQESNVSLSAFIDIFRSIVVKVITRSCLYHLTFHFIKKISHSFKNISFSIYFLVLKLFRYIYLKGKCKKV